jgi:uncharacterized protein YaiI (UPF0178 family)/DNA polymerase III epsilon subunit-like protein
MIVLDMEWNQPLSPDSPLAIRLCTTLPFEIIQIGAVKLETGERFKATCCLQQYKILSPRISKLTGITKQDVKHGEPFQDAMVRFAQFCGENPILLTWGFNDIPILRQNLSFYGLSTAITEQSYNLQIMFNQQHDPGSMVRGLSYAVDFFHLEVEDSYHDGLNDAAYTAEVAKHIDIPKGIAEYPDYLKYFEGDGDQAFLDCLRYANYTRFESFEDMIADPRMKDTKCPHCGILTEATEPIYPESGRMVWTCKCPEHGEFLIRVSFKRNRDDSMRGSKVVYAMDEAHRAQYKKAVEKAQRPRKAKTAPFKLYIDADGCPVINQALGAAARRHVESFLVCDTAHVFSRRGATTITVDKGADSADFAIVAKIAPGDLVITQDYGLAAMCLTKGAWVMDQNGMRYTAENIDGLLAQRAEATRIRRAGGRQRGPAKRTAEQNEAFMTAFQALMQEAFDHAAS